MLKDIYGRSISYLRVSLTERCNLKCGYCYGNAANCIESKESLSSRFILKIIHAFSRLGVDKIRFTGGEPLLREDLAEIIEETSHIGKFGIIGLTTNGVSLAPKLDRLVAAGLNRLNISLDSLDRKTYAAISGRDCLASVLTAINQALTYDEFGYVKINVVVMKGINDNEAPKFAEWALEMNIDLRFIEFMPAYKSGWSEDLFVGEEEIKALIGLDLIPVPTEKSRSGPARSFRYRDFPGKISFVSAVSRGFCGNCNRLRLTSNGELIGCLFDRRSVNLMSHIRESDSVEEIAARLRDIFDQKLYRKSPEINIADGCGPAMRGIGG